MDPRHEGLAGRDRCVLMGRRTFDMAGDPTATRSTTSTRALFVLTHQAPERAPARNENLYVTFVTDGLESAAPRRRGRR